MSIACTPIPRSEKEEVVRRAKQYAKNLNESLQAREKDVSRWREKASKLQRQVEEAQVGVSTKEDHLKRLNLELKAKLEREQRDRATLDILRAERDELDSDIRKLQTANARIIAELAVQQRVADKTQEMNSSLEQQKNIQDLELAFLTSELERMETEARSLKQEIAEKEQRTASITAITKETLEEASKIDADRKRIEAESAKIEALIRKQDSVIAAVARDIAESVDKEREIDVEIRRLRKHIEDENRKSDKLAAELFEESEVRKTRLTNELDEIAKKRAAIAARVEADELEIQAAQAEQQELDKRIASERKNEEELVREISRMQEELDKARESVLREIADKDAVGSDLKNMIKEAKKIARYEKERREELAKVEADLAKVQAEHAEQKAKRNYLEETVKVAEQELAAKEAELSSLEKEQEKRESLVERKRRELQKINQQNDEREQKIKEAEMNETSSEMTLTLEGQEKELKKQIASLRDRTENVQQESAETRKQLNELTIQHDEAQAALDQLRTKYMVLQQKERRLNGEHEAMEKDLKRREKEISKLKADQDKLGVIEAQFIEKINAVKDEIKAKTEALEVPPPQLEAQLVKLTEANETLASEIAQLLKDREATDTEMLEIERKIDIEKELQKSITAPARSDETKALEREIIQLKSELKRANKRKETLSKSLMQTVKKQDLLELKQLAKMRRSTSNRSVGPQLSSCSTMASMTNLVESQDRMHALVGQLHEELVQDHMAILENHENAVANGEMIPDIPGRRELVLGELRKWDKALIDPKLAKYPGLVNELKQWIDLNHKIIQS